MFLTTRRLAHEKLWRLWLWDAANLLPLQALPALQVGRDSADSGRLSAAWCLKTVQLRRFVHGENGWPALQSWPACTKVIQLRCSHLVSTADPPCILPLPDTTRWTSQAGLCGSDAAAADAFWQRLRRDCSVVPPVVDAAGLGPTELPPQHLFTVYAHAPPDYQGAPAAGSGCAACCGWLLCSVHGQLLWVQLLWVQLLYTPAVGCCCSACTPMGSCGAQVLQPASQVYAAGPAGQPQI